IMTQHVDPNTLHVGDDITFFRLNGTTLTHRIITIYENHEDSGKRGFETQGIENDRADADITSADNVIGKVIYSNLTAGLALSYIRANLVIFAIMSVLLIGLLAALRMVFAPAEAEPALQDCKVRQDIGDGTRPHSGPTTDAIDRGGELCGR
ncbi:MAG: hypothetical protein FWE87_03005, partial [Coriobacteriia bacterium]|nr:hypothetical protein [Coriobacteriia bacterium]